jgi:hypothetical protein
MISVYVVIWIMVSIIIYGLLVFRAGKLNHAESGEIMNDAESLLFVGAIVAIVWPLVLLAACVAAPFIGLYRLGKSFAKNDS